MLRRPIHGLGGSTVRNPSRALHIPGNYCSYSCQIDGLGFGVMHYRRLVGIMILGKLTAVIGLNFAEGITGAAAQKAARLGSKLREAAWIPPCFLLRTLASTTILGRRLETTTTPPLPPRRRRRLLLLPRLNLNPYLNRNRNRTRSSPT